MSKKSMSKEDILKKMGIDPTQVVKATKTDESLTLKGQVRNALKIQLNKAISENKHNRMISTIAQKTQKDANADPKVKDFDGRFLVIEEGELYTIVMPKLYFETYTTPYVNFMDNNDK